MSETEHVNLYADHQTGTLNAAGTLMRIKDAHNETLHTRPIFSNAGLKELDSSIIRNQGRNKGIDFVRSGDNEFSERSGT